MIALHALAGFSEDKEAARRFVNRFWPWSLGCVAALLSSGAFIFIPGWIGKYDPVPQIYVLLAGASFAFCIGLFVATWRRMVAAVPTIAMVAP